MLHVIPLQSISLSLHLWPYFLYWWSARIRRGTKPTQEKKLYYWSLRSGVRGVRTSPKGLYGLCLWALAWTAISQSSPERENKQVWFSGEKEREQPQMFLFQVKPNCKDKRGKKTEQRKQSPSHRKRDSNFYKQQIQVDKSCSQTEFVSPEHSLSATVAEQIGCQESPNCAENQLLQRLFFPVLGICFV